MSRSYKKNSYCGYNDKDFKKLANKAVRRKKNIPDGKSYRKIWNSWDICDFGYVLSKNEECYSKYKRK